MYHQPKLFLITGLAGINLCLLPSIKNVVLYRASLAAHSMLDFLSFSSLYASQLQNVLQLYDPNTCIE